MQGLQSSLKRFATPNSKRQLHYLRLFMASADNDLEKLLLEIAEERRREYGERIWRTVEYFTVVLSAILSVSIGISIELSKSSSSNSDYVFLVILFVLGCFVSITAWFNVRREYEHQLEAIAEKAKIEWYLGFGEKVVPQQKRLFKKDDHLLLERNVKQQHTFAKDEEWVKDRMKLWKNKQAALVWFSIVFWGFALIFTAAITLIIYSAYPNFAFGINVYWYPQIFFVIAFICCYVEHGKHTDITK